MIDDFNAPGKNSMGNQNSDKNIEDYIPDNVNESTVDYSSSEFSINNQSIDVKDEPQNNDNSDKPKNDFSPPPEKPKRNDLIFRNLLRNNG